MMNRQLTNGPLSLTIGALALLILLFLSHSAAFASGAGNHPITEAIIANDIAKVEELLKDGLNPSKQYSFKHPRWNMGEKTTKLPSTTAALFGRLNIIKMIYKRKNFKPPKYTSTVELCMAIAHRHTDVALFLIGKKAIVNPKGGCFKYWTPLARAKALGMIKAVKALVKAGAK